MHYMQFSMNALVFIINFKISFKIFKSVLDVQWRCAVLTEFFRHVLILSDLQLENVHHGTSAAVQYAVTALGVKKNLLQFN